MTEINFFINRKLQVTKRESGNKELFEKRQQFTSCENVRWDPCVFDPSPMPPQA